jgi:hypothetical protein
VIDTENMRGEVEAEVSVAMDLSEKALSSMTIAWKDREAIGLTAYAVVALRRAAALLESAADASARLRQALREEEDRAEGVERNPS